MKHNAILSFAAAFVAVVLPFVSSAKTAKIILADGGFTAGSAVDQPFDIGADVHVTFSQEGALAAPKFASTGKLTLTQGSVMTLAGKSADVSITKVVMTSAKASATFSNGSASCVPAGEFAIDKTLYTSTWSYPSGSNSVAISSTVGAPVISEIEVEYTGGTGGDTPTPPGPEDPEEPVYSQLYNNDFATAERFSEFQVINTVPDTYTWRYNRHKPCAEIQNDFSTTAQYGKDDYLVTPALEMKAGYTYQIRFEAWCENPSYPERIEAVIGTTTDALTTVIVPNTLIDSKTPVALTADFTVPSDGNYYVALHAVSDPGMYYLYANGLTINQGVAADAPAAPSGLAVTPAADGSKSVVISFNAPSLTASGDPLQEISKVNILCDGEVVTTLSAAPGEALAYTHTPANEGMHIYSVVAFKGDAPGLEATQKVFVGVAKPQPVSELTAIETDYGVVAFTWSAVTENIYGHAIDPSIVTYAISVDGRVIADDLTGTGATVTYLQPADPQEIVSFDILAKTSAGAAAAVCSTPTMAIGTPYAMPFEECFPDAMYTPGQTAEILPDANNRNATWQVYQMLLLDGIMPRTPDGGMLAFLPDNEGETSDFSTAKIHIDADASNPNLTFYWYKSEDYEERPQVFVNGQEQFVYLGYEGNVDWMRLSVPLDGFMGQDVRITFRAKANATINKTIIDDIRVADIPDFGVILTDARIPLAMRTGKTYPISASVEGTGVSMCDYCVVIKENGNELHNIESFLCGDQSNYYQVNYTCEAEGGTTIPFVIELKDRRNGQVVDSREFLVEVIDDNLPVAAGLTAFCGDDGVVTITWDAVQPSDFQPREITEGFESYTPFTINSAGEWSFIDGDAQPVVGIRDGYHGYPNMLKPMAFMTWDNHDGFFPQIGTSTFDPHTGGMCMMSAAIDCINGNDILNDDWLISPRLTGQEQTISFYARSSGMVFPEDIQIWYSTTGTVRSSFTLLRDILHVPADWTLYEQALPAGARYFAIRNNSHDQYMLFVDDITFTAAPVETTVAGYQVLAVNDVTPAATATSPVYNPLHEGLLTTPIFTTDALRDGHLIALRTYYANGSHTTTHPLMVTTNAITLPEADKSTDAINSSPASALYYDLHGRLLGTALPAHPGLYLRVTPTSTTKVTVR